jgi:hypothetical protein
LRPEADNGDKKKKKKEDEEVATEKSVEENSEKDEVSPMSLMPLPLLPSWCRN